MAALDFSEQDNEIIKYAIFLAQRQPCHKIYFIHIDDSRGIPDEVRDEIYGMPESDIETHLINQIKKEVAPYHTDNQGYNIEYLLEKGSPLDRLIHASAREKVDWVMVGKKSECAGSGNMLARFTRRSKCSVLIVPYDSQLLLHNLLVCIDFSKNSEFALNAAIHFAEGIDSASIYCHHVYRVPTGYHKTGKKFEEAAHIMKKNSKIKFKEFMSQVDTKGIEVTPIFSLDETGESAKLTKETAESIHADMVFVGSKGRTFAASIFLGSFSEKLIHQNSKIPLAIIKRENEMFGIIQALKSL